MTKAIENFISELKTQLFNGVGQRHEDLEKIIVSEKYNEMIEKVKTLTDDQIEKMPISIISSICDQILYAYNTK